MKEIIEKLIKGLAETISTEEVSITVQTVDNIVYKISLVTKDEEAFVGKDNVNFDALAHLVKRLITNKEGAEELKIVFDVNNIKSKKEEMLKDKVFAIAEKVKESKEDTLLDPMTSYERMVVHSHLQGIESIETESVGEGRERRVKIRYKKN